MGLIVGQITATIDGDNSPLQRSLNNSRNLGTMFASNFKNTLTSIGQGMTSLGNNLTKYVSLPIAAADTAIFTLGKNFEKELSKVTGLVGIASEQVDAWGADILKLAPQLGKAPQELAEALFYVTSAGLRGAEAMDVLEMSGKASAAGLGETATVADLVTSAMNAYGSENLSASKATDILVAAVREGKAEASELAASMGTVLPLASQMGVSFDQVAAAQAAMTRTGTDANEAATQLKGIMAGLIKPSKQAEEQLQAMGTSSEEMRKKIKEEGLINALFDLKEMTNKYGEEAMAKVFPNIRALMGVLDLMGNSAESNADIFDAVANSTGALDKAFQAASETVDFKWNAALSAIKTAAIEVFNAMKGMLIPMLETVASVFTKVAGKIQALSPLQQQLIILFSGLAAIIGPVLVVVGTAITGIGVTIASLITIITSLVTIISTVGLPVIAALGATFAIVMTVIGAVIGVITALVASFVYLWKTNEEFRNNVIATWNVIKLNAITIFNEIKKTINVVLKGIRAFWKEHGTDIMALVKSVWKFILTYIKQTMNILRDVIKLVCSLMRGDWKGAWDAIKSLLKTSATAIKSIVRSLWEVIKSLFRVGWDAIKSIVSASCSRIKSLFSTLGSSIKTKVSGMVNSAKNLFINMNVAVAKTISNMVTKIGQKLSGMKDKAREAGRAFVKALTSIDFVAAGMKIVNGIIRGIKNKIGELSAAASQIGTTIKNKLPFSPAKEGPLKDLHKVNFSSSILKSLKKAEEDINASFLGDMLLGNLSPDLNIKGAIGGNTQTNLNNPSFNFYGVNDVTKFMQEVKETLRRYGGKF